MLFGGVASKSDQILASLCRVKVSGGLIVYVMLSRPRALASLKSVGLTDKIREVIEQGPPEELVATFHKLFDEKIKDTKALAVEAAKRYKLLPECI